MFIFFPLSQCTLFSFSVLTQSLLSAFTPSFSYSLESIAFFQGKCVCLRPNNDRCLCVFVCSKCELSVCNTRVRLVQVEMVWWKRWGNSLQSLIIPQHLKKAFSEPASSEKGLRIWTATWRRRKARRRISAVYVHKQFEVTDASVLWTGLL